MARKFGKRVKIENINNLLIEDYLQKNNLKKKEFAQKCGISLKDLKNILDNTVPIEIIFKIEKEMGLKQYSLLEKSDKILFS